MHDSDTHSLDHLISSVDWANNASTFNKNCNMQQAENYREETQNLLSQQTVATLYQLAFSR